MSNHLPVQIKVKVVYCCSIVLNQSNRNKFNKIIPRETNQAKVTLAYLLVKPGTYKIAK